MAMRLPLASGYDARVLRDRLPRMLITDRTDRPEGADRGSTLLAPESRPVLQAAAVISAVALGGLAIVAVALLAAVRLP